MSETILACQGLTKIFHQGTQELRVLDGVDFRLQRGERAAIIGTSGAGKSTLLHLLGGLDTPSAGEVTIADQALNRISDSERSRLRNRYLGFVYQFHHLLAEFTALDNVAMPLLIRGLATREASHRAQAVLERVGLGERLHHRPGQLSGGERQRAAIARALVTEPGCVLADEPTGNLDRSSSEQVFELMLTMNQALGTGLIMVTHDHNLAERMDVVWLLRDGQLERHRS